MFGNDSIFIYTIRWKREKEVEKIENDIFFPIWCPLPAFLRALTSRFKLKIRHGSNPFTALIVLPKNLKILVRWERFIRFIESRIVFSTPSKMIWGFISEISRWIKIYEPRDCRTRWNNGRRNDFTITEIAKTATVYWLLNSVLLLLQHCYVLDGGYQFFTDANFNWIGESKERKSLNGIHCVYLNFTNNLFI